MSSNDLIHESHESAQKGASRGKTDIAWNHCRAVEGTNGKRHLICLHCNKTFKGGGINRVKLHLAGMKGDVEPCRKVPGDIRFQMEKSIEEFSLKKRKIQEEYEENNSYPDENLYVDDVVEIHGSFGQTFVNRGKVKESGKKPIQSYFMPRTTHGAQPTIKSVLQSKEAKEQCDIAISKWMFDAGLPFNATNSPYYQPMIDAIASMGAGYKGPGVSDIRGFLLRKNVDELNDYVESYRKIWNETGCTIMADGWTDQRRRTLINFLVYCPKGTVFLKSVDASDASKTSEMLFLLFKEVVTYVGPQNVVQIVTDNAANYQAAGRLLEQEFPTLYWSPCAAHCINLMLQDIGKLSEVVEVVGHAAKITKFIYNHCFALHLMRRHTNGKEIIRPAPTRFATNFIALQSILSQKVALQAMVTSKDWGSSSHARDSKAKKCVDLILDSRFWKLCGHIVKITEPLIRVLRLVDSENKPAMGYLFAAFHAARDEIIKRFQRRNLFVEPFLRILDKRWDNQLRKNLHAAGFWFNPSYQYDLEVMGKYRLTISGVLDVIEKYAYNDGELGNKLSSEMKLFRHAEGDFGRKLAINTRNTMMPDEWWQCYGSSAPNLQKLAIRVLSQTCSSSGCERNWSIFEHIHTKKRNRLEHQMLNDLVYVHHNLKLQKRKGPKKNYDPINFESFEESGDWILEDDVGFFGLHSGLETWIDN